VRGRAEDAEGADRGPGEHAQRAGQCDPEQKPGTCPHGWDGTCKCSHGVTGLPVALLCATMEVQTALLGPVGLVMEAQTPAVDLLGSALELQAP
jgi:hypothetical protein